MKRFKNILVVCEEGSDAALAVGRAQELALVNDAEITLIDVVDAAPGELARLFSRRSGDENRELEERILSAHADRLEQLAAPVRASGVPTEIAVLQGVPFVETIRKVLSSGHDLVLKAVHRSGPSAGPVFRGPDLHLIRKCPVPVWILKDDIAAHSVRLLAAVDPDPSDPVRNALNIKVMELATSLAARDGAELHIVNVWRLQEESTLRYGRFAMPEDELDAILNEHERKSRWRLNTLMEGFPDPESRYRIKHVKGLAGEVIPTYVDAAAIDTIVMGTVGRTGIRGLFIGNTAETILGRVDCSVLTVKPEGFVSPVADDTPMAAAADN